MLVEKEIKIYAYDIDVMGIVSNIVYVRWFEDLRTLFLDKYMPYEKALDEGKSPILASTEIQYKAPLTIYDKPMGLSYVEDMTRIKWSMVFEIRTESQVHCTGRQSGYFYDIEKKRPVRMAKQLIDEYQRQSLALSR